MCNKEKYEKVDDMRDNLKHSENLAKTKLAWMLIVDDTMKEMKKSTRKKAERKRRICSQVFLQNEKVE